ncbi:MAG: P-II family nitrogen regulator [Hyphomicrobiaceae bacterium]
MFLVTAMVQPFRLAQVEQELLLAGLVEHTVGECAGYGANPNFVTGSLTGTEIPDVFPKVKIEIPVPEDRCEQVIEAIIRGARLGKKGDGKIFVSELERVIDLSPGLLDGKFHYEGSQPAAEAAE